jgi:hypothetical protein
MNMADNEEVSPPVWHYVRVLLNDLDQRYVPQEGGTFTYFQQPERGFRFCYMVGHVISHMTSSNFLVPLHPLL